MSRKPPTLEDYCVGLGILVIVAVATLLLHSATARGAEPPLVQHPTIVAMFAKSNACRAQAGIPASRLDPKLCQEAQGYAWYLAQHHAQGHFADGGTPWSRAAAVGYQYAALGEVMAGDFETVDAAFYAWSQSPGHWADIMNPRYTDCGFGVGIDNRGRHYWIGVYATPGGQ